VCGDGSDRAAAPGRFDLVFADAPGGKLTGLDATIDAVAAGGVLVVDDMEPGRHDGDLKEPSPTWPPGCGPIRRSSRRRCRFRAVCSCRCGAAAPRKVPDRLR